MHPHVHEALERYIDAVNRLREAIAPHFGNLPDQARDDAAQAQRALADAESSLRQTADQAAADQAAEDQAAAADQRTVARTQPQTPQASGTQPQPPAGTLAGGAPAPGGSPPAQPAAPQQGTLAPNADEPMAGQGPIGTVDDPATHTPGDMRR